MTLEETIKRYKKHSECIQQTLITKEEAMNVYEWLKELETYRKQIQNLINNESFEIVNPFNTYEYARVVRVADLYDLMEVNADEDSD